MTNGTVKFFNNEKGFGFIKPADGTQEIFVHKNGLNDTIRDGDNVSYRVEQGRNGKGPVAVSVCKT